jgi:hypothetical protein
MTKSTILATLAVLACVAHAAPFVRHEPTLEAGSCPKYMCAESDLSETFGSSQCAYYNATANTYWLDECELENQSCENLRSTNSTCVAKLVPGPGTLKSYPGEPCSDQGDCEYGKCDTLNQVCVGLSVGTFCTYHGQCDLGLRCLDS